MVAAAVGGTGRALRLMTETLSSVPVTATVTGTGTAISV
jgi:hypothetical protein